MKKIKKVGKYFMTVLLVATLLFTWCAQSTVTVSAASKATYTIKKITQKKSYKKVSASYLYELPQLKGSSAAVKKINKSLKKDYQKDQENRESLFDWFESSKNYGYERAFVSHTTCSASYNQNGYISFRYGVNWYVGTAVYAYEYGKTYRLRDGKELGIQDVVAGKASNVKKTIATKYAKEVAERGYSYIMKMNLSDFQFFLMPGKKVIVYFGPIQPMGGHGPAQITLKSKI